MSININDEMNWVTEEFMRLHDQAYLLSRKPIEQIEFRIHQDILVPLENIRATIKNLEDAFAIGGVK